MNRINKLLYLIFFTLFLFNLMMGQGRNVLSEEKLINIGFNVEASHLLFAKIADDNSQLILRKISDGTEEVLDGSAVNAFMLSQYMIYQDGAKNVIVRDLKTNNENVLKDVSFYEPFYNKQGVVVYSRKYQILYVFHEKMKEVLRISNVSFFKMDRNKKRLIYLKGHDELIEYDADKSTKVSLDKKEFIIDDLRDIVFDAATEHFFSVHLKDDFLKVINWKDKEIDNCATFPLENYSLRYRIDTLQLNARVVGSNSIAVKLLKKNDEKWLSDPEILITNSNGFGANTEKVISKIPAVGILDLDNPGVIDLPADVPGSNYTAIGLTNSSVLSYQYDFNQSLIRANPVMNYKVKYLGNRKHSKTIRTLNHGQSIKFSDFSPYFFYFKNGDWFAYNPLVNNEFNLTSGIIDFKSRKHIFEEKIYWEPPNNIIITSDPSIVLIYDEFDIWKYNLRERVLDRLTKGREEKNVYRIVEKCFQRTNISWQLNSENVLNWNQNIILQYESLDRERQGLKALYPSLEVVDLICLNADITSVAISDSKLSFISQSYNFSPRINLLDLKTNKSEIIYVSNKTDTLVAKIKSEIISWNRSGKIGQALVKYPINYDEKIVYPAVVNIYEKKTGALHHYQHPKQLKPAGINYRDYIEDGYMVIEPDLTYTIGKPGFSATEHVVEAVEELSSKIPIDIANMGLTGHSFGGYETNFIITQTNKFKAAVAGAGFSDLVQGYLTMKWTEMRPDFWQFEDKQLRMGKGLFDDYEAYLQNSPIYHVKKVETPLLLWSGKDDYHVNWHQSVAMLLALKRLNKEAVLILYPNEAHVLKNQKNKIDMSKRTKQWFDYYLKNKDKPDWL